jgi:hypothetical protein
MISHIFSARKGFLYLGLLCFFIVEEFVMGWSVAIAASEEMIS